MHINVYINGVLQLPQTYRVTLGRIRLKTLDIPAKGTPIIVQSIRICGWKGGGASTRKPNERLMKRDGKTNKSRKYPVKHAKC